MTVSKDQNIAWSEVYARLPWVKRLKKNRQCSGFMRHTPLKAVSVLCVNGENLSPEDLAYKQKFQCKNSFVR